MALAEGESVLLAAELSLHTRTAIHFASCLTDGCGAGGRGAIFTLEPVEAGGEPQAESRAAVAAPAGGLTLIRCVGIGFVRTG
eukprot:SAG11_NODE_20312_length_448_cov_0.893983_1_plen_83_part_00